MYETRYPDYHRPARLLFLRRLGRSRPVRPGLLAAWWLTCAFGLGFVLRTPWCA